jgi:biopolymer transport protein ExbD
MAKKSSRDALGQDPVKIEMTPMIDVVFQLLIFFIFTLKPEDIFSHLDISRPSPDPNSKPEEQIQDLLTVMVYKDGYVLQGRRVSLTELDRQLTRMAGFSKKMSVVVKCTLDSPHSHLMKFLDICSKLRLTNISVFSM